jgi:hypothetical protein
MVFIDINKTILMEASLKVNKAAQRAANARVLLEATAAKAVATNNDGWTAEISKNTKRKAFIARPP